MALKMVKQPTASANLWAYGFFWKGHYFVQVIKHLWKSWKIWLCAKTILLRKLELRNLKTIIKSRKIQIAHFDLSYCGFPDSIQRTEGNGIVRGRVLKGKSIKNLSIELLPFYVYYIIDTHIVWCKTN